MSKLDGLVVRRLFVSTNRMGLVSFKSLILTDYCLRSWFVYQKLNILSALSVFCGLSHLSWFQWLKYIPPSFWPQITNHDVKTKNFKKVFFRSLLFHTTFSWCGKIEEKTKNICEVHTNFLVCTTYMVISWKIPLEAAKVSTVVKFFSAGKT